MVDRSTSAPLASPGIERSSLACPGAEALTVPTSSLPCPGTEPLAVPPSSLAGPGTGHRNIINPTLRPEPSSQHYWKAFINYWRGGQMKSDGIKLPESCLSLSWSLLRQPVKQRTISGVKIRNDKTKRKYLQDITPGYCSKMRIWAQNDIQYSGIKIETVWFFYD